VLAAAPRPAIPDAVDPVEHHLVGRVLTPSRRASRWHLSCSSGPPLYDGVPALAEFLWILPLALFVASVAQAVASWAVYRRTFPALGRMRAMQGLAQAVCQVALGFARVGPIGLIVGDVAGRVVGAEQLLRPLLGVLRSTRLTAGAMRRYARARWGFARVMTAASLVNALSLQVPFLLIPALFDLESSGQFFIAFRVSVLPASLVAAAMSQVFFGEVLVPPRPGRLENLARNATVSLFAFSIPTYLTSSRWVLSSSRRCSATSGRSPVCMPRSWPGAGLVSVFDQHALLVGRREREPGVHGGRARPEDRLAPGSVQHFTLTPGWSPLGGDRADQPRSVCADLRVASVHLTG
jgi:hypothetical protein